MLRKLQKSIDFIEEEAELNQKYFKKRSSALWQTTGKWLDRTWFPWLQ